MSATREGHRRGLATLLAFCMLFVGGAGVFLVSRAWTLPHPVATAFAEASGRVVALSTERCGTKSRPGTCYRPVVDYPAEGRTLQTTSRTHHRLASPFQVGDSVPVLLGNDGSVWLKPEWDSEQAADRYEVKREKTTLFLLGALMLVVGLVGAVLVAAVLAAKGPSPDGAPLESRAGEGS